MLYDRVLLGLALVAVLVLGVVGQSATAGFYISSLSDGSYDATLAPNQEITFDIIAGFSAIQVTNQRDYSIDVVRASSNLTITVITTVAPNTTSDWFLLPFNTNLGVTNSTGQVEGPTFIIFPAVRTNLFMNIQIDENPITQAPRQSWDTFVAIYTAVDDSYMQFTSNCNMDYTNQNLTCQVFTGNDFTDITTFNTSIGAEYNVAIQTSPPMIKKGGAPYITPFTFTVGPYYYDFKVVNTHEIMFLGLFESNQTYECYFTGNNAIATVKGHTDETTTQLYCEIPEGVLAKDSGNFLVSVNVPFSGTKPLMYTSPSADQKSKHQKWLPYVIAGAIVVGVIVIVTVLVVLKKRRQANYAPIA